jgi:hypothetical protein
MYKLSRVAIVLVLLLITGRVFAVPSFAHQTGLSCSVCHSDAPTLTAFGRHYREPCRVHRSCEQGLRKHEG